MSGMIAGGWEFVWSAYGITAAVLILYTVSVLARYRSENRRARDLPISDE